MLVDLVNKLSDKYDITIFTIYAKGELVEQLADNIKIKTLYNKNYSKLSSIEKKLIPLKLLINKKRIYKKNIQGDYDTEISFLEGPITRLFSVKNKRIKKIAWIHNDISQVFGKGLKATIKKFLDKKIYSKYEELIFVSKENLKNFNSTYKELSGIKKEVIYNYIDKDRIIEKSKDNAEVEFNKAIINLVTVARLVPQKAIDRFIKIHSRLITEGYQHEVYLIGDGSERIKLENLIKQNNIEKTFHLLGKKKNPYPYIKNADYFCLLSYFEGYGMVLEEAKILEKSVIITDTAAREAVQDYKESIILENTEEGIYEGIKACISKGKQESVNKKNEKYNNSDIIKQVIELIEK